jgi:hypothetical protein
LLLRTPLTQVQKSMHRVKPVAVVAAIDSIFQ